MNSGVNLNNQIQQWLLSQHVKVSNDWLEACLDWLCGENQINSPNAAQLQKQAYEQWLVADLNELSVAILPNQVKDDKFTLTGIYCLQLNSLVDVSQPFYGQLLQLQNKDNSNTNVSAETQFTQKPWESKASRMLMMKLTDGVTDVSAVEYRRITSLNSQLSPGCKVRIKGPVECRRGVLMLSQNNIQILGGEVEELFPSNNHEAILCQHLGRPIQNRAHSAVTQSNNAAPAEAHLPPELISQLTDEDFTTEQESGYASAATVNPTSNASFPSPAFNSTTMEFDNTNDITDMEMLEEMERVEAGRVRDVSRSAAASVNTADSVPDELWEDINFETDDFVTVSNRPNVVDVTNEPHSSSNVGEQQRCYGKQLSIEDAFKQNFKSLPEPLRQCASRPLLQQGSATDSLQQSTSGSVSSKLSIKKRLYEAESTLPVHRKENPLQNPIKCERMSQSYSRECSSNNAPSPPKQDAGHRSTLVPGVPFFKSEILNKKPYKCLCQVQDLKTFEAESNSFLVKACVTTLLSKLQSNAGSGWTLQARICDGTGVLDVCFSDQVLTELIGFSSKQAEAVKLRGDAGQSFNLRLGMKRCRDSIIEMCKVMEIHLPVPNATVMRLLDVDQTYWDYIA